ncbi:MAG: ribbon-helix-helix domain-containing protein [Pseudolabrys sp.]
MDQREHVKKTFVIKRSILINGHKTSVSLEDEFWRGLHEVAHDKNTTVPRLVEEIDRTTNNRNLSSAIRVFVFNYFQQTFIKAAE